MTSVVAPMNQTEDLLLQRLQRRRDAAPESDDARELEGQIVQLIEGQLKADLRGILVGKYGARVDQKHASRRFTELLQRFFTRVLARFPSGLLQVQTRSDLIKYIAAALCNMVKEHYRQEKCHADHADAIALFAKMREAEWRRDCPDVSL